MRTRNRKNDRKNRLKQYLKAKYGMKYEKGGKTGEGEPPEADFLLKRDPLADYDRETVGVAEGARGIGTLGTTTASDEARRQMSFLVPPEGMAPPPEEVPEERQRGEDMAPMPTRGPKVIRRGQERDIMGRSPRAEEKGHEDEFTGFILAPYLRTGQVPTNTKVLNPKTRQYEDRQMEPEEIADYIFKNQVRRAPNKMMTREQAYEKALGVMRSRS